MRQKMAAALGTFMIAGGLLGASLTFGPTSVDAHEGNQGDAHEQMHAMTDTMMGEGASERMHEAMPGSEEMMDVCAAAMSDGMMNMMNGMMRGGMMHGMDHMMDHGQEGH